MPAGVNSFLKNIVNAYNKKETILAEKENREPELMSPISSHTLRHTGCTRLGENNVNPKVMNAYNKKETILAEKENREPELMSPISSHTLRHTGCTRLGENNVNPKVMQYGWGAGCPVDIR